MSNFSEGFDERQHSYWEGKMNGAVLISFIGQNYWAVVTETSWDPEQPVGERPKNRTEGESTRVGAAVCICWGGGGGRVNSGDTEGCLCWLTELFVTKGPTHVCIMCMYQVHTFWQHILGVHYRLFLLMIAHIQQMFLAIQQMLLAIRIQQPGFQLKDDCMWFHGLRVQLIVQSLSLVTRQSNERES